jgi:hypothetical protein
MDSLFLGEYPSRFGFIHVHYEWIKDQISGAK